MTTLSLQPIDFAALITKVGPRGDAWPREADSVQQQAYLAFGELFSDLNARANDLVTEAFPGTTYELLPQWEASLGLPDTCTPLAVTVQQRIAAVVAKLTARGGMTAPYFIAVAAALGYTITIDEFAPFRADANSADDPCYGDEWAFVWQVNVPDEIVDVFFVADDSVADEALDTYETGVLECRLRAIAPAGKLLLFNYASGVLGIGSFSIGISPI